jgi:predicted amidohydrolase YtcJ
VEGFPRHDLLSAAIPDHPVILHHASGHAILVNEKAMEIADVNRQTSFDNGGEIICDERGIPTGIFVENAAGLIGQHIPDNDPSVLQKAFDLAMQACASNGITSFHDAGEGPEAIELFKQNLARENFNVRLYVMLSNTKPLLNTYYESGPEIGLGDDFLTIRSIKLFADGALGSRGAWLLEPYSDMPDEYGHMTTSMEEVRKVCKNALKYGFQVCTHAIGDRANREVLDVYEETINNDVRDHRFRIEHAQHLSAADIGRFARLGVLPAMQAIHMSSDRPWAIDRLGKERIEEGAYAWQKLIQTGARIINGTDAPVEPISPLACIYASVTRKTLKGEPEGGYEADQKMTRLQALQSYTINPAYGAFEENIKGSIEVGKYADFAVFDRDIMTVPEYELLQTRVEMTIVNGEVVFKRE